MYGYKKTNLVTRLIPSWIHLQDEMKYDFIELEFSNENLNEVQIQKLCFDYLQHSLPFKPEKLRIYSVVNSKYYDKT